MKHKITTKRSKTYWWSLGLCVLVLVLVWSGVAYLRHATDGIKVDMTPPVSVMGAGPNSSASSKPLPKVDITPLKNLVDPKPASYTERFKKGAASKDPKEKYDAYRLARECKFSQETFNSGKVQGAEMDCGDFLLSQDNPIHSTEMRLKPLKECAEMGGH